MGLDNDRGEPSFTRLRRPSFTLHYGATAAALGIEPDPNLANTHIVPPPRVREFEQGLIVYYEALRLLHRARQRMQRAVRESNDYVNHIRAVHVLCEVLKTATERHWPASDRPSRMPRAARALYDAAQREIDFAMPVRHTHLIEVEALRRTAADVYRIYSGAGRNLGAELKSILEDDRIDVMWKSMATNMAAEHQEVAAMLLESTPSETDSASFTTQALEESAPGSSLIGVLKFALGTSRGGVDLRAMMVRHVAAQKLVELSRAPAAARRAGLTALQRLLGNTEEEARAIELALRGHRVRGRTVPIQEDCEEAIRETQQKLTRSLRQARYSGGRGRDAAVADVEQALPATTMKRVGNALSVIQALLVIYDVASSEEQHRSEFEIAVASVNLTGSILTIGRQGATLLRYGATTLAARFTSVRVEGFVSTCRVVGGVADMGGRFVGGVGAVLGIVAGVIEIREGLAGDQIDIPRVAVGSLQVTAGVVAFAGLLCASPGLQIAGVVVGITAGAAGFIYQFGQQRIEAGRPLAYKSLRGLLHALLPENAGSNPTRFENITRNVNLANKVVELRNTLSDWDAWTVECPRTWSVDVPNRDFREEQPLLRSLYRIGLTREGNAIFRGYTRLRDAQIAREQEA
jgi:hypothetical protein